MDDINLIEDVEAFTKTLEEEGLVPVDQFIEVNDEQHIAVGVYSKLDNNDEVVERCNIVESMHIVNDRIEWLNNIIVEERIEWHVGCEDTDPNEDASQWV